MFNLKLADLNILVENKFPYVEKMCKNYITDEAKSDFSVSVSKEEILREKTEECGDPGYLESLAVYRKIAEKIIEFDGFLLHGVVLETGGEGVAFCAKSGTGKSTHAALWLKYLGDKCSVVNGDKPLIRIKDGKAVAYGTPWCGKEGINNNTSVVLKGVCILQRGIENKIEKIEKNKVLPYLTTQIYVPKNGMKMIKTLDLVDAFVKGTDFYLLKCNMDISAAEVAYNGVFC
ncbi:MAG: hypothetical protein E7415_06935 [Ruminococcaceae bacterium]|nr:hypothetical protein [Oscillospiraceae bacterium]